MRFEVPQFIEIEDKIFGPFTWRQFVYLAGGVGIGVVSFITLPIYLFILIGLPIAGLGFLLAFFPVNNRPFSIFLESVMKFYQGNRMYHWKKKSEVVYRGEGDRSFALNQKPTGSMPQVGSGSINTLSRKLELSALEKKN